MKRRDLLTLAGASAVSGSIFLYTTRDGKVVRAEMTITDGDESVITSDGEVESLTVTVEDFLLEGEGLDESESVDVEFSAAADANELSFVDSAELNPDGETDPVFDESDLEDALGSLVLELLASNGDGIDPGDVSVDQDGDTETFEIAFHAEASQGSTSDEIEDTFNLTVENIEDKYVLETKEDIIALANNDDPYSDDDLDEDFYIGNDIDMESEEITPIGYEYSEDVNITLYGREQTIQNVTVNETDSEDVGLFSNLAADSHMMNLTFENIDISGDDRNVGLFGQVSGVVENISIESGTIESLSDTVGGITGYLLFGGEIINCSSGATVDSENGSEVGGLVGRLEDATISDSEATGHVVAPGSDDVGGVVGAILFGGEISNCSSDATVDSDGGSDVGGLAGILNSGAISDSEATGDVVTPEATEVGGLVGRSFDTISESHTDATIVENTAETFPVGGLVGLQEADGEIIDCYTVGEIDTGFRVGGLVGDNNGRIEESHTEGPITTSGSNVGGIAGRHLDGVITDSFTTSDVTGPGSVGGIVGGNESTIEYTYYMGSEIRSSGDNVGGLVGDQDDTGEVIESYVATGGIVGTDEEEDQTIGALFGTFSGDVSEGTLYWDNERLQNDEETEEAVGNPVGDDDDYPELEDNDRMTDEMQDDDAVDNLDGFDFDDIWLTQDDDYPILAVEQDIILEIGGDTGDTVFENVDDEAEATVTDDGEDVTNDATIESSDDTVVEIDGTTVIATGEGSATVTATYEGEESDVLVRVGVQEITLSFPYQTIDEGYRMGYTVTALFEDGSEDEVTDDTSVTSDDEDIIEVHEGDNEIEGILSGIANVEAEIYGETDSLDREVSIIEFIEHQDIETNLLEGERTDYSVDANFENGAVEDVTADATVDIDDETIVTAHEEDEELEGIEDGSTTVTFEFRNEQDDVVIEVSASYELTVTVEEQDTNDPLEDATVEAESADSSTTETQTTDADGITVFDPLAEDDYTVSVTKEDYEDDSASLTLDEDESILFELKGPDHPEATAVDIRESGGGGNPDYEIEWEAESPIDALDIVTLQIIEDDGTVNNERDIDISGSFEEGENVVEIDGNPDIIEGVVIVQDTDGRTDEDSEPL